MSAKLRLIIEHVKKKKKGFMQPIPISWNKPVRLHSQAKIDQGRDYFAENKK